MSEDWLDWYSGTGPTEEKGGVELADDGCEYDRRKGACGEREEEDEEVSACMEAAGAGAGDG
jgi:hypothetical protein